MGDKQERAFNTSKDQLIRSPILRLPDFSKEFILQCDASYVGIGSTLHFRHTKDSCFLLSLSAKNILILREITLLAKENAWPSCMELRKFKNTCMGGNSSYKQTSVRCRTSRKAHQTTDDWLDWNYFFSHTSSELKP